MFYSNSSRRGKSLEEVCFTITITVAITIAITITITITITAEFDNSLRRFGREMYWNIPIDHSWNAMGTEMGVGMGCLEMDKVMDLEMGMARFIYF